MTDALGSLLVLGGAAGRVYRKCDTDRIQVAPRHTGEVVNQLLRQGFLILGDEVRLRCGAVVMSVTLLAVPRSTQRLLPRWEDLADRVAKQKRKGGNNNG
ncbi:hypothetical protein ACTOWY_40855 [Crossiella sp. CA198]